MKLKLKEGLGFGSLFHFILIIKQIGILCCIKKWINIFVGVFNYFGIAVFALQQGHCSFIILYVIDNKYKTLTQTLSIPLILKQFNYSKYFNAFFSFWMGNWSWVGENKKITLNYPSEN